jgi:anaerobic magnesium-protoporphyrin IX monomethyl ester cyclase
LKRVLLVYPAPAKASAEFPPLGIGYIASYITSKEQEVIAKTLDFTVEDFTDEGWRKELREFAPETVGISTLTFNFHSAMRIAKLTKEFNPNILVVMGGIHPTVNSEECLGYCDVVVRGEGEQTFLEIIRGETLSKIAGISYRDRTGVHHNPDREQIQNLDALPFPAHHLYKMRLYTVYPGWVISGSRGCPFHCIFCSSARMWGRVIRCRSAKNIVDEAEYLHEVFGICRVTFYDDELNVPKGRLMDICDEIIHRSLNTKVTFECQLRANRQLISPELFRKMKQANFTHILLGVESGSDKVLKSIGKSLTTEEARQAINMARRAGIKWVTGFFMIGNWNETIIDIMKTWIFVLSNRLDIKLSICTPMPGTRLYAMMKKLGYIRADFDWGSFDWATPVARTNMMPRWPLFTLYVVSVFFLHLPTAFARGHRGKLIAANIFRYARDRMRMVR